MINQCMAFENLKNQRKIWKKKIFSSSYICFRKFEGGKIPKWNSSPNGTWLHQIDHFGSQIQYQQQFSLSIIEI